MDHDMHDDGLVHSHGWATEPPPSLGHPLRPATGAQMPQITQATAQQEDGHDDGLVHGHGWACTDTSRRLHG